MATPEEILAFWLDEIGPKGWNKKDDALDKTIRERFGDAWVGAMEGRYALWLTYPSGTLAYIILTDQFSRNMFRGTPQAFASDRIALAAAKQAIHRGWDTKIDTPAKRFFYMPLLHSENLCDQDRCVRMMKDRMPDDELSLLHARAHREVIRRFGRFPYRNDALGRNSSVAERRFLDEDGGYGGILRELKQKVAA